MESTFRTFAIFGRKVRKTMINPIRFEIQSLLRFVNIKERDEYPRY